MELSFQRHATGTKRATASSFLMYCILEIKKLRPARRKHNYRENMSPRSTFHCSKMHDTNLEPKFEEKLRAPIWTSKPNLKKKNVLPAGRPKPDLKNNYVLPSGRPVGYFHIPSLLFCVGVALFSFQIGVQRAASTSTNL